jgi:hypothetical protein
LSLQPFRLKGPLSESSLAISAGANGEIWLENRDGAIMLNAAQAGLTFGSRRYELYIQITQ